MPFCPLDLENRMTVCMEYPAMTPKWESRKTPPEWFPECPERIRSTQKEPLHLCEVRRLFLHLFSESSGTGAAVQRAFLGPLSSGAESGALLPPEFRIAANCCSCLREVTPSFS